MSKDFEHIIIGGQQRSGTSLVRAIIGSHSKISIFQYDLTLWPKFSMIYANRVLNQEERAKLVSEVLNHEKVQLSDINFSISEFDSLIKDTESDNSFFGTFYQFFLSLYLQKAEREIIGIKTPENEFYTDQIFSDFPKTKFIQVMRNPLDVAVSLKEAKSKWWGGKINYNSHIRLWQKSAETAKQNTIKYAGNYLVIKYEDVISNPEVITREICEFLEVTYEPEMLLMQNQPGWTGSNSSFQKKSGESNFKTTSINRYKNQLDSKIKDLYFFFLENNLKHFGYDYEKAVQPNSAVLKFKINEFSESFKENLIHVIRRSPFYGVAKKIASK